MKTHVVSKFLLIALVPGVFGGCANIPEQHHGAATGAGIGAASGALAGAVLAGDGSNTQKW